MTEESMYAVRVHETGGPDVLRYEQVPRPSVQSGEVLIRTRAIGVNPPDWYVRDGMVILPPEMRPDIPYPITLGSDVSGVVEAVADDVDAFSPGDEVLGLVRFPDAVGQTYAEYVTAPASDLALKPSGIDHVQAAALPMAGLTAWQHLHAVGHDEIPPFQAFPHQPVPIGPDSRILVNGAAGGVGHIVVQLAKLAGASVTAVASGAHAEFLRSLGADDFIDYTQQAADETARDFDLVVDSVGGPGVDRFIKTVKRGGALFPIFFGPFDPAEAEAHGVTVSGTQVRSDGAQLAHLAQLVDRGELTVAIDSSFPLSDAREAHERASHGHLRGKIVLTVA